MDEVNRTLYIPLYGKAMVSRKGILLHDPKAEEIWDREGFALKGKAKSKWLTYYMGMRAAVFDQWLRERMEEDAGAVILHIGCGLDGRIARLGSGGHPWYDVDFPSVIAERRKYYQETEDYHMLSADAREPQWIRALPADRAAIVVMEGVSMYLQRQELLRLLQALQEHFFNVSLLMDCYTEFAARASRHANPVNRVGVSTLYGVDDPKCLETGKLKFLSEYSLTPEEMIQELSGFERRFFRLMFGGSMTKKLYCLYAYHTPEKRESIS